MTHASVAQFRSEFDHFLYAPVDEGDGGTFLTVLSVLARLDVDPWQEAASLAQMSRENATHRLASLIAALPAGLLAHLEPRTIAARLIARLPPTPSFSAVARRVSPQTGSVNNSRAIIYVIVINVIFMALAFGGQYFRADHGPTAPPASCGRRGSASPCRSRSTAAASSATDR